MSARSSIAPITFATVFPGPTISTNTKTTSSQIQCAAWRCGGPISFPTSSIANCRSPGWRRVEPFMTENTFYLWIGQHENGHYSKAHAHTSAAVLICVKGKGYTYTWPEHLGLTPWKDGKGDHVKRVDYEPVGMVSAAPGGARWFHQHFGASKDPFRLTAWFGPHNPGREPGPPGEKHVDYTAMDI